MCNHSAYRPAPTRFRNRIPFDAHHVTAGEYSLAVGNGVELHVACGSLLRNGRVPEAILRLDEAEAILQQQNLTLLAAAVSRRRGELEGESGLFESRSPTRS